MYKQHKQVIYANPDSAYQRFVNAVKLKNPIDSDKREMSYEFLCDM